jgi:putative transposase
MPRAPRQVLEGVPHHIVLRGNNRRRLFSYPRDYLHFVSLMNRHLSSSELSVHALCLMPNHVHLLLTPFRKLALGAFIKKVAQRYAQVRNKRYGTTGKLFEQRYYSRPMRSDKHLAIATAYIDLNPVRAHLVGDGNDYEWSTHRIHCGMTCRTKSLHSLWSPSDWYRRLAEDPAEQAAAYRDWIADCRERDEWDEVRKDPNSPRGGAPTRPNRSRAAG